jgi:methionyl aminopeptidase
MITNDPEQIKALREGGKILASILLIVAQKTVPGVTTAELNNLAEAEIKKAKVRGSFKNYKSRYDDAPYPASLCVSVNDEIVHGIPSQKRILKEGDIVGLDLGIWHKNLCTDAAITVGAGKLKPKDQKLVEVTRRSLENGLKAVYAGNTIGDIGHAIQTTAENGGFQVVRELVGHGVGKDVHEEPDVPCYGQPGQGLKLVSGMVLAIEPMLTAGHWKIKIAADRWTIKTYDQSNSAHFEHTVVVTDDGCEIMTVA